MSKFSQGLPKDQQPNTFFVVRMTAQDIIDAVNNDQALGLQEFVRFEENRELRVVFLSEALLSYGSSNLVR